MMSWSLGYAVQAKSDLLAWEKLSLHPELHECHTLHFLQMAAEKLCKAYLAAQGQPPDVLRSSHAFISGVLPIIARQILSRDAGRIANTGWMMNAIKTLARQIELLHPQVNNDGAAPANCEYPWAGPDGEVIAPAQHRFNLTLLHERAGTSLMKIMRIATDEIIQQG
jgi:hypothetical protein